jgi:hypothetical protein
MKSRDSLRLSTIRLLKGAIQLEEIKLKKSLEDTEIFDVISKQIKLRKDSIIEFEKANRMDTVESLNKEIEILMEYLPEQMSNEELERIINDTIKEVNAVSLKDFGNVMKNLIPKIKGKADSKQASEIIQSKLK